MAGACLFVGHAVSRCEAGLIFSLSGTGTGGTAISYEVEFEFVDRDSNAGTGVGGDGLETFKATLTNNSTLTDVRGNLITGLWFSLNGVSPLNVSSFDGVAGTVINGVDGGNIPDDTSTDVDIAPADNNTATDGTYQFEAGPFGVSNNGDDYSAFQYGLTTVGGGLGSFNGADLNDGNGQDDFGIVAFDTAITSNVAGTLPVIDTTAMFFWDRPSDFTSLDQIDSLVRISRGSLPDGFLQTPEPTSLWLVSIALLLCGGHRLRLT